MIETSAVAPSQAPANHPAWTFQQREDQQTLRARNQQLNCYLQINITSEAAHHQALVRE
jgi:hypothetical protein